MVKDKECIFPLWALLEAVCSVPLWARQTRQGDLQECSQKGLEGSKRASVGGSGVSDYLMTSPSAHWAAVMPSLLLQAVTTLTLAESPGATGHAKHFRTSIWDPGFSGNRPWRRQGNESAFYSISGVPRNSMAPS